MRVEWDFDDVSVKLTNVDRVMFPDAGITKREVLEYYRDIAEYMLPEVRDRALSIERFTKGIDAGGFFQKHWQKHYPEWIRSEELGAKTVVRYPIADSAAAIVYFANQGGIAMHVWTSRVAAPEYPDLLVFDLDPPDGRFDLVRFAALEIKELCDSIDLPTFVKTTGSKGLHVVVPLARRHEWDEVKAFSHALALAIANERPRDYTAKAAKRERTHRIYIDWLRNSEGATAIAPYSVRARPGAPVATPLHWDEVAGRMRPEKFHAGNVPRRLQGLHSDPWRALRRKGQTLTAAMKRKLDITP